MHRCVAVAGDMLEVRDSYAYVNGVKEIPPEEVQFIQHPKYSLKRDQYVTFPAGMNYSRDSWGPMRIPKKGDVIPLHANNYTAWRVFIAREGHSSTLDGQIIKIDGKIVNSYTVEQDYVFGMGDNRNDSQDSRYFGFIPVRSITGIPFMVYFSQSSEGKGIRWERILKGIE